MTLSSKGWLGVSALLLTIGLIPCVARADVIYDLAAGTTTGGGQPTTPLSFVLDLHDDFAPGAFSRSCNTYCYSQTGSLADFTLTAYAGAFVLGVLNDVPDSAFEDTSGDFLGGSGTLRWNTSMSSISLSFGNGVWNATFNSDYPPYERVCGAAGCSAAGAVAMVPEPATLTIFLAGLLAVTAFRRRRARL